MKLNYEGKKSLPFVFEALQPLNVFVKFNIFWLHYNVFQKSQPTTDKAIVVMPSDQQDS